MWSTFAHSPRSTALYWARTAPLAVRCPAMVGSEAQDWAKDRGEMAAAKAVARMTVRMDDPFDANNSVNTVYL
ncbi:hypothetical protein MACH15_10870 [Maricaulis maris]|nr:hypothetical protein MACH15_10870 [Maricaulis maris]